MFEATVDAMALAMTPRREIFATADSMPAGTRFRGRLAHGAIHFAEAFFAATFFEGFFVGCFFAARFTDFFAVLLVPFGRRAFAAFLAVFGARAFVVAFALVFLRLVAFLTAVLLRVLAAELRPVAAE